MKITAMNKVLSTFEMGEQLTNKQIMVKISGSLTKPEKSNLRNAIYKLVEWGMLEKEMIGKIQHYTLVKAKSDYTPRLVNGYNKRKKTEPKPVKQLKPLEWYANLKCYQVLELAKKHRLPLPKTKEDIIKFHEQVAI